MDESTSSTKKRNRIALGVSGGIACYKSAEILRGLQTEGFEVVVVMTRNASRFVTPLTFASLSGERVYGDLFQENGLETTASDPFDHILLAESIDLFLVAPATANCIAKMSAGVSDDFFTTFHLAVTAPIVVAPAMNTRMWMHSSVQENINTLRSRGVRFIDPGVGMMACGTSGPGRLAEASDIVNYVSILLSHSTDLTGKKVLVTAGPTIEDIDPVRFISNRSSGRMGFAIAEAAQARGGEVTLVSGPTDLYFPGTVRVRTTQEMHDAVIDHFEDSDIVVKAAAPLDFRVASVANKKIKKDSELHLDFEPTPDILSELGKRKNGKILVGFAAETDEHLKFGQQKLQSKNLDLIVVNSVFGSDSAFGGHSNQADILDAAGKHENIPRMSKHEMADRIIDRIVELL